MLRSGPISMWLILGGLALNLAGMSLFMIGSRESYPAPFLPLVVWALTVGSFASLGLGLFMSLRKSTLDT